MTRNGLASTPTEAPAGFDTAALERLASAVEALAKTTDPDLKCFTPAEAADLLGVTENWVTEAIQGRRIPFTYVGRFPRLTAAHLREIAASGEVKPSKFARAAA